MINANELRIGNILWQDKVESIGEDGINISAELDYGPMAVLRSTYSFNELKPIPLTEKWLLKFGFSKEGQYLWLNGFKFSVANFNDGPNLIIRFSYNGFMGMGVKLDYVHQLQNLYFALTGKELELK